MSRAKPSETNSQSIARPTQTRIIRPTAEEDARITAAALADPDAQPAADLFKRRGRPKTAAPKLPVLLRLDRDVVTRFKKDGDGWQTRMNDALRKAAGLR